MRVDDVPIAHPCRIPEAPAEHRTAETYCSRCRKHVHDLSSMTEDAAVVFTELNRERDVCVSYWADANANLVHAPRRSGSMHTGSALGMVAVAVACQQTAPQAQGVAVSSAGSQLEPEAPCTALELNADEATAASATTALTAPLDSGTAAAGSSVVGSPTAGRAVSATAPFHGRHRGTVLRRPTLPQATGNAAPNK